MAQMAAMQKSFIAGNADLLSDMDQETGVVIESDKPQLTHTCILCQQDTVVSAKEPALVLCALIQKSLVHAKDRKTPDLADQVRSIFNFFNHPKPVFQIFDIPLFRSTNKRPQLHTSTCGHMMHRHCWQSYFDNVLAKETRRPYRLRQPTSFDVERQEFLCPLCECIANTVIPVLPKRPTCKRKEPELTFDRFLFSLQTILKLRKKSLGEQYSKTSTLEVPTLASVRKPITYQ